MKNRPAHTLSLKEKEKHIVLRDNRVLVLTEPGAGKTLVLVRKFLRHLNENRGPVGLITYTRAARDRLYEAVKASLGTWDEHRGRITTIHSLAKGILRKYYGDAPISKEEDLRTFLENRLKEEVREKVHYFNAEAMAKDLLTLYRMVWAGVISLEMLKRHPFFGNLPYKLYAELMEYKGEKRAFDEIVRDALNYIEDEEKFYWLGVDGGEDLTPVEVLFATSLAENITVVFDPYQQIYNFRGALFSPTFFDEMGYSVIKLNTVRRPVPKYLMEALLGRKGRGRKGIPVDVVRTSDPILYGVERAVALSYKGSVGILVGNKWMVEEIRKYLAKDLSDQLMAEAEGIKQELILFLESVMATGNGMAQWSLFSPRKRWEEFRKEYTSLGLYTGLSQLLANHVMDRLTELGLVAFYPVVRAFEELIKESRERGESLQEILRKMSHYDVSRVRDNYFNLLSPVHVSTVHSAKGKEFDYVVYIPTMPRRSQGKVLEGMVDLSNGIDRLDAVALTRARKAYVVVIGPDKRLAQRYGGRVVKAKHLHVEKIPLPPFDVETVKQHFKELLEGKRYLSFSAIKTMEERPFDYFVIYILGYVFGEKYTQFFELGSKVHDAMELLLRGMPKEEVEKKFPEKVVQSYVGPFYGVIEKALERGWKVDEVESERYIWLESNGKRYRFKGRLDVVLRHEEKKKKVIIDFKTSRYEEELFSWYREQMVLYKRMLKAEDPEWDVEAYLLYLDSKGKAQLIEVEEEEPKKIYKALEILEVYAEDPKAFLQKALENSKRNDAYLQMPWIDRLRERLKMELEGQ